MTPTDDANPRAFPTARALRLPEPHGATAAFVAAVQAKYGEPFAHSWLSARSCRFTDTTIFTIPLARETLAKYCEALIEEHGVSIVACPDVTRALYREIDSKEGRAS